MRIFAESSFVSDTSDHRVNGLRWYQYLLWYPKTKIHLQKVQITFNHLHLILTYLFVPRVDLLDYFDAAMLPRCGIVGSDATSAVPAAFYRRASRCRGPASILSDQPYADFALRCSVQRNKLADIFLAAIPYRSGVKAFIWINTERLIVKIEKLINAIPNVPLGSYYRHGLSGITSGPDRTT